MTLHALARSYTNLGRAILRYPSAPWQDALAHGQLQSKVWAVSTLASLRYDIGMVYVLGGWLGTLGPLLFAQPELTIRKVRSFDLDPSCAPIADQLNIDQVIDDWRYKAVTKDMMAIDYHEHRYQIMTEQQPAEMVEQPDTIINTSCDHLSDFAAWWKLLPRGKLVLLQNNNFAQCDGDHVNTVGALDEFFDQAPMTELLYADEREFPQVPYRRFMLIGVK